MCTSVKEPINPVNKQMCRWLLTLWEYGHDKVYKTIEHIILKSIIYKAIGDTKHVNLGTIARL